MPAPAMMNKVLRLPHALWQRARRWARDPDRFLQDVSGVVHVGANQGSERDAYGRLGLDVIWIEPIPEVYACLCANLRGFPRQRAIQALVTDVDGRTHEFHVSSNGGASSSILDLKRHQEMWPDVTYTTSLTIESSTLPTLLQREGVDLARYQALVLDTQGSELLVLQGARSILHCFKYVKIEVADFEAYAGCCQLGDIAAFMAASDYKEFSRTCFAGRAGVGNYYDIVYRKRDR